MITDRDRGFLDPGKKRASEARSCSLMDAVPDMLFRYSTDGVYLDVEIKSDRRLAAEERRFYRAGRLIGSRVGDVLDLEIAGPLMKGIKKAAKTGELQVIEYSYALDKEHRYFEARLVSAGPDEVISIVRDVTGRKKIEAALHYQFEFEKMVADISSTFVETPTVRTDEAIDYALELSGKFFQADRGFLYRFSNDCLFMTNTHEWCAPGITSQRERNQNYRVDKRRWWVKQILEGKHVHVFDVEALPPEMESDKKEFRAEEIQSFLTIPLIDEERVFGYFGFDGVKEKKSWTEDQIALLKVVAEIIAGAIIKRETEEALKESERRYREILATMEEGYYEANLEGIIIYCNDASCRLFGYEPGELNGISYKKLYKEPEQAYKTFHRVFLTGEPEKGLILKMIRKDGSIRYGELSISLMKDKEGHVTGFKGIGKDVTERTEYEQRLRYLSLYDLLTGTFNRAYFDTELARLNLSREYPITIISTDLDGLKLVNDTMGHDAGDRLLVSCAEVMKSSLRQSDILARVGGDEFAAILPSTDKATGESIVSRIRENTERYNKENRDLPLGISIGVATAEDSDLLLKDLYKQADDLMYHDKLYYRKSSRGKIVQSLLTALAEIDYIAEGHTSRLEEICRAMGKKINLSPRQLHDLILLAQVHDLGKVGIPEQILFKKGLLADDWEIMRGHSEKGYRLASSSPELAGVADLILKHHERWDGEGYPLGLKETEIPVECRILAIADAFDAMTHKRPYNNIKTEDEAVEELKAYAGSQFDPRLVAVFLEILKEKESGI